MATNIYNIISNDVAKYRVFSRGGQGGQIAPSENSFAPPEMKHEIG